MIICNGKHAAQQETTLWNWGQEETRLSICTLLPPPYPSPSAVSLGTACRAFSRQSDTVLIWGREGLVPECGTTQSQNSRRREEGKRREGRRREERRGENMCLPQDPVTLTLYGWVVAKELVWLGLVRDQWLGRQGRRGLAQGLWARHSR